MGGFGESVRNLEFGAGPLLSPSCISVSFGDVFPSPSLLDLAFVGDFDLLGDFGLRGTSKVVGSLDEMFKSVCNCWSLFFKEDELDAPDDIEN